MINLLTESCDSPETAKVKNGGSRHREKTLAKEETSASRRGRRRRVAAIHVVAAGWTPGSCRLNHWRLLNAGWTSPGSCLKKKTQQLQQKKGRRKKKNNSGFRQRKDVVGFRREKKQTASDGCWLLMAHKKEKKKTQKRNGQGKEETAFSW